MKINKKQSIFRSISSKIAIYKRNYARLTEKARSARFLGINFLLQTLQSSNCFMALTSYDY
jgi:hypothetical protein